MERRHLISPTMTEPDADGFLDAGTLGLGAAAVAAPLTAADDAFADLSFAQVGSASYAAATFDAEKYPGLPLASHVVAARLDAEDEPAALTAVPQQLSVAEVAEVAEGGHVSDANLVTNESVGADESIAGAPEVRPHGGAFGIASTSAATTFKSATPAATALLADAMSHLFDAATATQTVAATGSAPQASGPAAARDAADDPDGHLPNPESLQDAVSTFSSAARAAARAAMSPAVRAMLGGGLAEVIRAAASGATAAGGSSSAEAAAGAAASARAEGAATEGEALVTRLGLERPLHDSAAAASTSDQQHGKGAGQPPLLDRRLKIAGAQVHAAAGDVPANLAKLRALAAAAGRSGVDLLVVPEAFLQGYHIGGPALRRTAVEVPSRAEIAAALRTRGRGAAGGAAGAAASSAGGAGGWLPADANPLLHACLAAADAGVAIILPFAELGPAPMHLRDALTPPLRAMPGWDDARDACLLHLHVQAGLPEGVASDVESASSTAAAGGAAPAASGREAAAAAPHLRPRAVYNSSILIDADGTIAAHYRKTHLWGCAYEKAIFTPGPGPPSEHMIGVPAAVAARAKAGISTGSLAAASAAASSSPSAAAPSRSLIGGQPWRWDPYHPACLKALPHIPIGLLVCFDVEFPEPARLYAARGAAAVVACMASGEGQGFTSRHIIPTRAAENHVAVMYANFPSVPLPPVTPAVLERLGFAASSAAGSGGSAAAAGDGAAAAAADSSVAAAATGRQLSLPGSIECRYAGATTIAGPRGRPLVSLPPYVCTTDPVEKARRATAAPILCSNHYCPDETLALTLAAHAPGAGCSCHCFSKLEASDSDGGVSGVHAQLRQCTARTLCAPTAAAAAAAAAAGAAAPLSPPTAAEGWPCDEVVVVCAFSPFEREFAEDAARNPYLADRRTDLFDWSAC